LGCGVDALLPSYPALAFCFTTAYASSSHALHYIHLDFHDRDPLIDRCYDNKGNFLGVGLDWSLAPVVNAPLRSS
jgi:hypothetical protein